MSNLLERIQHEGAPLIDGENVTFLWPGQHPPQLIGDFNRWEGERTPPAEVAPGLWAYSTTLPRDAYIEYAYTYGDRRVLDPFNRRTTPNGMGATNQFFFMPDARTTTLVRRARGVPRGAVTRHIVEGGDMIVGGRRAVYLYRPPTCDPCPLLVVLDGSEYLRRARLPTIVDNLIALRRIRPIALAMVAHAGHARIVEYSCNDIIVGYLLRHVLPFAREQLNLLDIDAAPGAYGILGASMGGLMALYSAIRVPEIFGRAISQSGAFGFRLRDNDSLLFELIRRSEAKPLKIWMDVGRFEHLFSVNQRMHKQLLEKGYDVTYREYNGGHNYTAWRDDLWRGLEAVYGPAMSI